MRVFLIQAMIDFCEFFLIIMLCILLIHYHYYIVVGGIFGRTVVHLTRVSVVGNQTDDII